MKKSGLAFAALCGLLIFGCKKDTSPKADDFFIGATKNGINWVGKPAAGTIANGDSAQVVGFKAAGEETLRFNFKLKGPGTYNIKAGEAAYFTTVGMDAVTSNYKIDTTAANTVTIQSFEPKSGYTHGFFQLNFVKITGSGADKLTFSNGKFYVYVKY
ncbi:MAG TPA: DUF6252 family protein [Mucilaginibacter sp.]